MNIKHTALAAAVATALGASSAYALPTSVTPDLTVIQMGSSAMQLPIQQVWTDFCASGTLTIYEDAGTGKNYRAYFCTLGTRSPIPTTLQGKNMLYFERLTGGSVYGVNPVALSQAEAYMDLSTCTSAASGVSPCTAATLATAVPDVGISDVEPKLFSGPNVPAGFVALSTAQLGALHIDSLLQQTFAVGLGSSIKGSVSNLTSSQIASIVNGAVTDWHTINQGVAAGTKITVCLRAPGSGTQAGANALFLANPCSANGQIPVGSGSNIVLNSSTGNLLTCLDGQPNGMGILSLADGPSASDNFAIASIDSVQASASNSAIGAYKYNVESTLQYRTSTNLTTLQGQLIQVLAKILSTPSSLATVNSGLPNAALNSTQNNGTPSAPYQASNPVEWGSRGGSTCSPYVLSFPL